MFVITECSLYPSVRYNQVFVKTEFVITEFVITEVLISEFVITEFHCICLKQNLPLRTAEVLGSMPLTKTYCKWGRGVDSRY